MVNWAQPAGQVCEALGGVGGGVDLQSWGRPTCFLASRHSASQSGIKSPPHPLGVEVSRSSLCTLLKNALSFRGKETPSSWKESAFSCSLGSSATHAAPFWVTHRRTRRSRESRVRIAAAREVSGRARCMHTVARGAPRKTERSPSHAWLRGLASGDSVFYA